MFKAIRVRLAKAAHQRALDEARAYSRRPASMGWSVTVQMALDGAEFAAARRYAALVGAPFHRAW